MKKYGLLFCLSLNIALSGFSQTWEKINTGYDYIFKGIEFPGGQGMTGFAGGQSQTYMGDGIVIKTNDGGTTWSQLWTGVDQGIEGISFADFNIGYVCGWSAYFAKTTNGGLTWNLINPSSDAFYYSDVVFKDALHGIVTAQTNSSLGGVYATIDGGNTWVTGSGLTGIPAKVCYVTGNTYFLVNNGGDIQKSSDGGLTWVTVYSSGAVLAGIDFKNSMTGIACGDDGLIIKTFDGGVTWAQQSIAFGYPIWHDAAWNGQNDVYIVGTPEYIYKSLDGGVTWFDDYLQTTGIPALYEILFTVEGRGYIIGSQGWFYRLVPEFNASFTTNSNHVCNGGTVQFYDQSIGSPMAWNWTFEGGVPATSSLQNPVVTYSTPGVYDVELIISLGGFTDTLISNDLIHVEVPVTLTPSQPTGPIEICGLSNYEYSTTSVPNATGYSWVTTPTDAGTFSSTGNIGTLAASNTWSGAFTIEVAGENACGNGPSSPVLNCNLYHQPIVYSLFAGGGYCAGQPGYEIKLEDSELGVDYRLFKDGIATGLLVPGTGSELSFGYQLEGTYTVTTENGFCISTMSGASIVYLIDPPATASQPSGPGSLCSGSQATYTASLPANSFTLMWTVTPQSAGIVTQPSITTAIVTWNAGFSGSAQLTVQGQNECENGPASPPLLVDVYPNPEPVVSGPVSACQNSVLDYVTSDNPGNTYVWTVTGGSIVAGAGTANITVKWTSAGPGTISVTETSAENCQGTSSLFTVLVDPCVGIHHEASTESLKVYPNPVTDFLFVELAQKSGKAVQLVFVDPAGRVVKNHFVSNNMMTAEKVDISQLKSGYYLLQLLIDGILASQTKIIKY